MNPRDQEISTKAAGWALFIGYPGTQMREWLDGLSSVQRGFFCAAFALHLSRVLGDEAQGALVITQFVGMQTAAAANMDPDALRAALDTARLAAATE